MKIDKIWYKDVKLSVKSDDDIKNLIRGHETPVWPLNAPPKRVFYTVKILR